MINEIELRFQMQKFNALLLFYLFTVIIDFIKKLSYSKDIH